MQEAFRRGGYEGVMRNYRGELAECTQSNLFIVKNGAALTPPLDAGLLPGITRAFLFEVGEDARHPGSRGGPARRRPVRRRRSVSHQHHARGRADRRRSTTERSAAARRDRSHARCSKAMRQKAQELTRARSQARPDNSLGYSAFSYVRGVRLRPDPRDPPEADTTHQQKL